VFPHLTAADGQALARELIDASADAEHTQLTIGVAAYPTINYTRHQIVNNAEKALEHASFFGPGTITPFDAVSLNISGDRHYQAGNLEGAIREYQKRFAARSRGRQSAQQPGGLLWGIEGFNKALAPLKMRSGWPRKR
jgi:hypothetical protein